jgi:uncharacterized protein (DUF362 family)
MKVKGSFVSIVKTDTSVYEKVDFRKLITISLNILEKKGIEIPSNGKVFIKPNVIMDASAREGITTEPALISGLIDCLKKRGVKKVYVGDSPASYMKSQYTFHATGMDEAVKKAGGEVIDIDREEERIDIELTNSDMLTKISVPRKAVEADFLINFAKLKTHRIGSMTCSVKNWVGFIPQDVRLRFHQTRLAKLVAELHRALPEDICFADAIVVGEGDGPDLTKPRFLGVLLASNDPVALDSIGAELLSINHGQLIFPWTAYLDGIGEIDRNKIEVIGPDIAELAIRVETPVCVLYNRFPCNIILGALCDGCFAWFIGPALFWQRDGIWEKIKSVAGKPTFMMGYNANDIHFEEHLREGPYFVIGDCTPEKYRKEPRAVHIPGCCPGPLIPETILKICKIEEGDKWK